MTAILDWLKGKKSYIIAALAVIYTGGISQGYWQHSILIDGLLTGGGLAALRAGVNNAVAATQPQAK